MQAPDMLRAKVTQVRGRAGRQNHFKPLYKCIFASNTALLCRSPRGEHCSFFPFKSIFDIYINNPHLYNGRNRF